MKHTVPSLILALSVCARPALAQGDGRGDRTIGIELNRDRSDTRIERLHEEKRQSDKARAQEQEKKDEPRKSPGKSGEEKR